MIRYIIVLKRLVELRRIRPRVRVLVNGVSQFACSRGEYRILHRLPRSVRDLVVSTARLPL